MYQKNKTIWLLFLTIALLLALGLIVTACGSGGEEPEAAATEAGAPETETEAEATEAPAAEEKVWPISDMTTSELLTFYDEVLPFTDQLPLPEGPIGDGEIVIGFSQTGFNHPWRVEMIKSAQAEVARHPNVSLVVTDGNVDIAKQNN
ncbi:MAG: hypothetical protein ACWGQW_22475, partial [bacterium]